MCVCANSFIVSFQFLFSFVILKSYAFRRQKELESKLVEEETSKRIEEIVAKRVEEELEKRKDDIEKEVLRRVEEAKKIMEKEMVEEMERRQKMELEAQKAKEVIANAILTCTEIFTLLFLQDMRTIFLLKVPTKYFKCKKLL